MALTELPVLVGGVGQLWQGDLDLGRRAAERLAAEFADRSDVLVEDLYYGAVAVAQRLEDLQPASFIVVGAEQRGRRPGTVEVRHVTRHERPVEDVQSWVGDAVTGYVGIDLLLVVAAALGALPADTTVVEVEPESIAPSERMSAAADLALERALDAVRAEVMERGASSAPAGSTPPWVAAR